MIHGSKKCHADAWSMMVVVKSLLAVGISDAISTRYLKVRPNSEGGRTFGSRLVIEKTDGDSVWRQPPSARYRARLSNIAYVRDG